MSEGTRDLDIASGISRKKTTTYARVPTVASTKNDLID
jgi:hypothetical protein